MLSFLFWRSQFCAANIFPFIYFSNLYEYILLQRTIDMEEYIKYLEFSQSELTLMTSADDSIHRLKSTPKALFTTPFSVTTSPEK